MQRLTWSLLGDEQRRAALARPAVALDASTRQQAAEIVASVRADGDAALLALTARLDRVQINSLAVDEDEFGRALASLGAGSLAAIDVAIENVRRFHEAQLPVTIDVETVPGVRCERISHAIESVGLYVPAGSAPLPSAAVMLAVPAVIAGCDRVILCTPPRRDGTVDPGVLVAARRAGVTEVYKVGGAQAIAAMAYGTETVPRVAKIFGPGNAWVTAAKALVAGDAGGAAIDMPAGPSEVLVIADQTANSDFVASDLLSQAEHGTDSQVILVCTDGETIDAVVAAVDRQLPTLSRQDIARGALLHSRAIEAATMSEAVAISNAYAPEHLIIQTEAPRQLLPSVRNAGSVFLGPWSPESAGDYCSGTNHVLPTYGAARSYSGLSVAQFMRQMTVQELSRDGLQLLAPTIAEFARMEGLDAHAAAVSRRVGENMA